LFGRIALRQKRPNFDITLARARSLESVPLKGENYQLGDGRFNCSEFENNCSLPEQRESPSSVNEHARLRWRADLLNKGRTFGASKRTEDGFRIYEISWKLSGIENGSKPDIEIEISCLGKYSNHVRIPLQ